MALLKCTECGKEISDNSKKCIQCGSPIKKEKKKIDTKKVLFISISLFVIIGIIIGIIIKLNNDKEKKELEEQERIIENKRKVENEYKQNIDEVIDLMLDGGITAEEVGDLTYDVWYNSIWEKKDNKTNKYTMKNGKFNDDFNTSLSNLFNDKSYKENIEKIEKNRTDVKSYMDKLKNPPNKYVSEYDEIEEFYDCYLTFINIAINPTGSLTNFSTNYNNAKSDFLKQYNKIRE